MGRKSSTKIVFQLLILSITFALMKVQSISSKCAFAGKCSQICTKLSCECIDGFELGRDRKSCSPINPSWKIVYGTVNKVGFLGRQSDSKEWSPEIDPTFNISVRSFTFDARNQMVYYISRIQQPGHIFSNTTVYRSHLKGATNSIPITNHGLSSPESVAFEWITGNLYYIEPPSKSIIACQNATDDENCAVILGRDQLATAEMLTLDPNLGIMFWVETDHNNKTAIFRGGMDGMFVERIVEPTYHLINSLAIDQGNKRIFWSEPSEPEVKIHSAYYNGKDLRTLKHIPTGFVQSIDIFGDHLFKMEKWEGRYMIRNADKFTGQEVTSHVNLPSMPGTAQKISVFHSASQPVLRKNPCNKNNSSCTHACVLSPPSSQQSGDYRCLCPIRLQNNTRTGVFACYGTQYCLRDSISVRLEEHTDYLVIAHENILSFIRPANLNHLMYNTRLERVEISQIEKINALAYNPLNDTIILTDSIQIFEFEMKSTNLRILVEEKGASKVVAMGVDEIGGNLYWIVESGTVSVMSLRTGEVVELLHGLENICDMLMISEQRAFFLASLSSTGGVDIKSYHLDGSGLKSEYHDPRPTTCVVLGHNNESDAILWSEIDHSGVIESIRLQPDGTMSKGEPVIPPINVLNHITHFPNSFATYQNAIFWVDSITMKLNLLYSTQAELSHTSRPIFSESEFCQAKLNQSLPFRTQMIIINRTNQNSPRINPCRHKSCSHLCLISAQEHPSSESTDLVVECKCFSGFKLLLDGKSCINESTDVPTDRKGRHLIPDKDGAAITNDTTEAASSRVASEETLILGMTKIPGILTSVAVIILFCIVGVALVCFLRRKTTTKIDKYLGDNEMKEFFEGSNDKLMQACRKIRYDKSTWEISKNFFTIDCKEKLDLGEFGVILKGRVSPKIVGNMRTPEVDAAVKTSKRDSPISLRKHLKEIKTMIYLGKHENILGFIGANTEEMDRGLVHIFLQYCELGCLGQYLRREDTRTSIDVSDLSRWSQEIAGGMEFLEKKKVIHGDLGTRNILLTSDKSAKITGFGLTRTISHSLFLNQQTWRWLAPESFRTEFTDKTDVWAFGVTLWELHSFGEIPYSRLSWSEDFPSLIEFGHVQLEKPEACNNECYSVILKCWKIDANLRPNFVQLKQELSSFSLDMTRI